MVACLVLLEVTGQGAALSSCLRFLPGWLEVDRATNYRPLGRISSGGAGGGAHREVVNQNCVAGAGRLPGSGSYFTIRCEVEITKVFHFEGVI